MQHQSYFNRDAPRYKCCCNSIHVKTGTWIIAVLATIGVVMNGVSSVVHYAAGAHSYAGSLAGGLIGLVLGLIAVICLFIGLRSERAPFLLPYLILQGIAVIFYLFMLVIAIIAVTGSTSGIAFDWVKASSYSEPDGGWDKKAVQIAGGALLAVTVVSLVILFWFWWVVFKCYRFFKEQCEQLSRAPMQNVTYSNQPAYGQPAAQYPTYPAYDNAQQAPKYM